ncbi:hypothetical protein BH20ACT9_BH20ACT9_20360 [soil metagenome]
MGQTERDRPDHGTLAGPADAPSSALPPRRPRLLGSRYALLERVASGGMASVWRARDDVLDRLVAVKILHDHLAADDDFRARFRREAVSAAKLTHPNVIGLYDTGRDGDYVYLVMEYVDGPTLKELMRARGTLSYGQAARIGEAVARALAYAHTRGVVHRDVKPANILIGEDGAVKVADFGIAKAEEAVEDLTRTGMVLGTAAYVAPEQILGQQVAGAADQYALGVLLYESLTGRQPFKGDSAVATAARRLEHDPEPLRSLRPDVPERLADAVTRAMARDPSDRFPSTAGLAATLAAYADPDSDPDARPVASPADHTPTVDLPRQASRRPHDTADLAVDAPRPSLPPRPSRRRGRRIGALVAVIALAVVAAGLAVTTGLLDAAGGRPRGGEQPPGSEPLVGLDVSRVESFDPEGDGSENDDRLAYLVDGDPATAWRTDTYNSSAFGGLKGGVGVRVDLGAERQVEAVTLTTATPGIEFDVRVADTPSDDLDDWRPVATVDQTGERVGLGFDDPERTRHVLIWLTGTLPDVAGGYRAEISGLTIRGRPA